MVGKRLEGWNRALLSRGGMYTLVQSVLSYIPVYFLSLLKISVRVAKKIEKLMRDFSWEGHDEGFKFRLVKWEVVICLRNKGGLAIGNVVAGNSAILSKWLWRFPLESESLWHSIIKSKYGV